MIKIDTLYALYVYSINAKIIRNKALIEKYSKEVEDYLPQLSAIEPLISSIISYSDLLNGHIKSLPADALINASTSLKYANVIIKEYYALRSPINTLSEDNKSLSNKKITIKVYKEILRKCNNKIGEWIINTGGVYNDKFLGAISLRHKKETNRPNWGKSNKNKQAILDRGGIPYNKEDEKRCLDAGIPYHGEHWLDKDYPDGLLVVYWQMNTFVKQYIGDTLTVRFRATKGNYGIAKRLSDYYLTNVDYSKYVRAETPKERFDKIKANASKK